MKEMIGILDQDLSYAEMLSRRINEDGDFPYHMTVFQTSEDLFAALKAAPLAGLLLSTGIEEEAVFSADIRVLIYLTDIRDYAAIRGIPAVYKYRPLSDLKEEVKRLMSAAEERKSGLPGRGPAESGCVWIGVAGASGRVCKTGFSLVLGMLLSRNARTLYVNLEPCSGFQTLFEKPFEQDLADVLYRFEAGDPEFCTEEMLEDCHGLKVLPPVGLPEDLYHAPPAGVAAAVAAAAGKLRADAVVIDLGPDLRFTEQFFPLLSKIYVPVLQNTGQEGKQEMFMEYLHRLQEEAGPVPVEEVAVRPLRSFSKGRVYLDRLLWSELGDCARQVLGGMI